MRSRESDAVTGGWSAGLGLRSPHPKSGPKAPDSPESSLWSMFEPWSKAFKQGPTTSSCPTPVRNFDHRSFGGGVRSLKAIRFRCQGLMIVAPESELGRSWSAWLAGWGWPGWLLDEVPDKMAHPESTPVWLRRHVTGFQDASSTVGVGHAVAGQLTTIAAQPELGVATGPP